MLFSFLTPIFNYKVSYDSNIIDTNNTTLFKRDITSKVFDQNYDKFSFRFSYNQDNNLIIELPSNVNEVKNNDECAVYLKHGNIICFVKGVFYDDDEGEFIIKIIEYYNICENLDSLEVKYNVFYRKKISNEAKYEFRNLLKNDLLLQLINDDLPDQKIIYNKEELILKCPYKMKHPEKRDKLTLQFKNLSDNNEIVTVKGSFFVGSNKTDFNIENIFFSEEERNEGEKTLTEKNLNNYVIGYIGEVNQRNKDKFLKFLKENKLTFLNSSLENQFLVYNEETEKIVFTEFSGNIILTNNQEIKIVYVRNDEISRKVTVQGFFTESNRTFIFWITNIYFESKK